MQLIHAVMLLLGCSHDAQVCEALEVYEPYYETVAKCEESVSAQQHLAGEGYPITIAKCLSVDGLPAKDAVKIDWHFNREGVLFAYAGPVDNPQEPILPGDVLVASSDEQPAN